MAEFGEEVYRRRLETDSLLRRFTIEYFVNHPLGDNFLLSKEGTRDPQYGYYKAGTIQTGSPPHYDRVTIIYEDLAGTGPHYRYLYKAGTVSLPIERKTGTEGNTLPWKPIWNYNVIEKKGNHGSVNISAFTGATTLGDASSQEFGSFIRSNQGLPTSGTGDDAKAIVPGLEATKPGVQSFWVPSPTVTEIIYTRNTKEGGLLSDFLPTVGGRKSPGKLFGLDGNASSWLVKSADAERINDWYKVVIEYQYMEYGWDVDIYPTKGS